jgi:GalNAc-alpha-(1->4)-GalNAc-alpha-(1->3)-diNAcBac-PP-undecaprenol alpha-1,4-N-acetyl-D-galactosaminyltransferase
MRKDQFPEKKITFVLGGLVGGGAEKVASILIGEWYSRGYEITLITRLGTEEDFFRVPSGINRIVLGGEGESANKFIALFKNIPYIWKLRDAIKQIDSPVLISFLTKSNIHTLLATIGLGVRVIISERNDTTRQIYPWPWPLLRKWLYTYSNKVTANSNIALNGMKEYVPVNKLHYIPNPVFIPNEKALPHKSKLILNVGRLVPQKAQSILFEGFSKLDKSLRNEWRCEVLGDGEERINLESKIRQLQISENTELHGLVSNPSDYYKRAGIFVLPSEYEGTPNVLLEAMAHGLPCIVSDCLPGALEYITNGENGFTFKAGDANDLSLKIEVLIKDPDLRKRMGKKSVERVEHLSVENVLQIWEKIIQS